MQIDVRTARRNTVLAGLDEATLSALLPALRLTSLPSGLVLHEPGQPIEAVHFPLTGVVSIVADLGVELVVETATIGREGMIGIPLVLGAVAPTERALVQVPGEALTMTAQDLTARIKHRG